MKKINKQTIIIALITLFVGFLIGNLLQSDDSDQQISEHEHQHGEDDVWTCPMHLQIRQNEPGKCPICGMALVKVDQENSAESANLKMSDAAMKLANIVTEEVRLDRTEKNIRLSGKIKPDERFISSQSSHIDGRIEKLMVSYTGEFVKKGQVIANVYSPELVNAEKELFVAHRMKDTQPELFAAAVEKLKNWKLTNRQIDEILAAGKPKDYFPILSDLSGIVVDKKVNEGDHVMEGASMFKIADLSKLWLLLEVNESDISNVKVGDQVDYTIQSFPGEQFAGIITFIDPVINPDTRVAFARVTIDNPTGRLKPEMFAIATVKSQLRTGDEKIQVPASAILWTGKRSIVYVKQQVNGEPVFQLREVTLGPKLDDQYIISEGLTEGEQIVVSGAFSVDAAAQLEGKPSMMNKDDKNAVFAVNKSTQIPIPQIEQVGVNLSDTVFQVPSAFKLAIRGIYEAYLPVKEALVESDVMKVKSFVPALIQAISDVDSGLSDSRAKEEWQKDKSVLIANGQKISQESDLAEMRKALSPLSDQLYHSLKKFDVNTGGYRQYCPMAFDYKGAYWLSDSDEILNPYFGDEMLTCGNVEEDL
ncbi:MAG: efflux RND transporter periplasmic adaptor subunit [Bacteroidota bacterium]